MGSHSGLFTLFNSNSMLTKTGCLAYQMYTAHLLQLLKEKVQRPEVKNVHRNKIKCLSSWDANVPTPQSRLLSMVPRPYSRCEHAHLFCFVEYEICHPDLFGVLCADKIRLCWENHASLEPLQVICEAVFQDIVFQCILHKKFFFLISIIDCLFIIFVAV